MTLRFYRSSLRSMRNRDWIRLSVRAYTIAGIMWLFKIFFSNKLSAYITIRSTNGRRYGSSDHEFTILHNVEYCSHFHISHIRISHIFKAWRKLDIKQKFQEKTFPRKFKGKIINKSQKINAIINPCRFPREDVY